MKFRRLSVEELAELENEFIEFLAVNSVTGRDWIELKKSNQEEVDRLIDLFSDIVMEKALSKIRFLEFRAAKDWKVFKCKDEEIEMIAMNAPEDNDLDLTDKLTSDDLYEGKAEIYSAEKSYNGERTREIFEMLENGCQISDEMTFEMMKKLLGE